MLTEKENFLRLLNGKIPEFIPKYDMMNWLTMAHLFDTKKTPEGYDIDEFGMQHTTTAESMGGKMPVPGRILLDDITKWRDIIKMPDLSTVDFEKVSKQDLEKKDVVNNPVSIAAGDVFMKLMNFMSFADGLCAMYEEPEEVYALFDTLTNYYLELEAKMIKYYNPDVFCLMDDVAAAQMPFISKDMYQALVKPFHKKMADMARENNLPITIHCCGRCELFLDDYVEIGVSAWEPAQVSNDLVGIKKKFGRKLAIMGGWDNTGAISSAETSDSELEEALIKYVDTFAPDGGFAFMAMVQGDFQSDEFKRRMGIVNRIYMDYARDWYKNH